MVLIVGLAVLTKQLTLNVSTADGNAWISSDNSKRVAGGEGVYILPERCRSAARQRDKSDLKKQ